jgi:hypothetical protein
MTFKKQWDKLPNFMNLTKDYKSLNFFRNPYKTLYLKNQLLNTQSWNKVANFKLFGEILYLLLIYANGSKYYFIF